MPHDHRDEAQARTLRRGEDGILKLRPGLRHLDLHELRLRRLQVARGVVRRRGHADHLQAAVRAHPPQQPQHEVARPHEGPVVLHDADEGRRHARQRRAHREAESVALGQSQQLGAAPVRRGVLLHQLLQRVHVRLVGLRALLGHDSASELRGGGALVAVADDDAAAPEELGGEGPHTPQRLFDQLRRRIRRRWRSRQDDRAELTDFTHGFTGMDLHKDPPDKAKVRRQEL
mmetsp:Transcript_30474/g.87355  ORF Transcript_30474/g.87355 Transcript_30474/m.87355 type:complete len:231 (+) Transcript_30474:511-1203(+)